MAGELRGLSIQQPIAYLAGVLAGDGYISRPAGNPAGGHLGLHVADGDFAEAFADALAVAYGIDARRVLESAGYWRVRVRNRGGCFDYLRTYPADGSDDERGAWLRGFFDSDGNASLVPVPRRGPRSWVRRASFYKTDMAVLGAAMEHLEALRIPFRPLRKVTLAPGHLGTKQVYELAIRSSQGNYARFAAEVGSSLHRKQATLNAIAASYSDRATASREAGAKGAATKRARAKAERLPTLLAAVAEHVTMGGKTTHGALTHMDGYWSARKTLGLTHDQIVKMALEKREGAA